MRTKWVRERQCATAVCHLLCRCGRIHCGALGVEPNPGLHYTQRTERSSSSSISSASAVVGGRLTGSHVRQGICHGAGKKNAPRSEAGGPEKGVRGARVYDPPFIPARFLPEQTNVPAGDGSKKREPPHASPWQALSMRRILYTHTHAHLVWSRRLPRPRPRSAPLIG